MNHFSVCLKLTQHCKLTISSVQSLSCFSLQPLDCSTPGFSSIINSRSLLKLMSIELVMPSNHLILCCPLRCLPSIFPNFRVFSNELFLHIGWPKHWSFSNRPFNKHTVERTTEKLGYQDAESLGPSWGLCISTVLEWNPNSSFWGVGRSF